MKRAKNIHNLDTLEREMYRLKLEARNIEEKLDHNLDHLQENYFSMTMNSIFRNKKEGEGKAGFFESFFKSESFNAAVNKITEHIVDKAAAGIENLIDKIFRKKQ
ncbi:MAG: hypothetical protein Q8941_02125 [Bacteroidota bacterium]|nr:hypothetical protein [Bacteroidota bacterium]